MSSPLTLINHESDIWTMDFFPNEFKCKPLTFHNSCSFFILPGGEVFIFNRNSDWRRTVLSSLGEQLEFWDFGFIFCSFFVFAAFTPCPISTYATWYFQLFRMSWIFNFSSFFFLLFSISHWFSFSWSCIFTNFLFLLVQLWLEKGIDVFRR